MEIAGKVFAVSGAASGLGAAIALSLAEQGARLALLDRDQDALEGVLASCREASCMVPDQMQSYKLDVTDEAAVVATFEQIAGHFGQLNGLVHCAGVLRDGMLLKVKDGSVVERMSLEQFQQVIDINLTGTFLCGREAAAQMINTASQGVIINFSSVSRAGNIGQSNYSASKAAVSAMTVTWGKELARHNIRVAAIAPGVCATRMTDAMKPEAMQRLKSAIPLGRLGDVSEIAIAVDFLIDNDYYTGRTLELDGGIRV